jgi:hypothetical protein
MKTLSPIGLTLTVTLATLALAGAGAPTAAEGAASQGPGGAATAAMRQPLAAPRAAMAHLPRTLSPSVPRWVNISPPRVSTNTTHPPSNFGFQAIAIDPLHPKTLYVGTCYQGLWKTQDGGKTWFEVNTGTNGKILNTGRLWSIAIDRFHPQTLYVASGYGFEQGVWKSTDGGVDWQEMLPGTSTVAQRTSQDVHTIATDPYRSGHILVTFHSGWNATGGLGGVLESFDGGAHWIIHEPRRSWGAGHSISFLNNSSTWLLGTQTDGLWRTADGGHTWTHVSPLGRADGPWGLYHAANGIWYAGGQYRLLRSADDGRSWTAVGPGAGIGAYYTVIGDGRYVYAQPAVSFVNPNPTHYFYAPERGGTTWAQYNGQTFSDGPFSMAYDPVNHVVYSSNWNAGVWKLQVQGSHASGQ